MSNMKKILVVAVFGLVSFGVSLGLSLMFGGSPKAPPRAALDQSDTFIGGGPALERSSLADVMRLRPREKELGILIDEVKAERTEVRQVQAQLEAEQGRVQMIRKDLLAQIQELQAQHDKLLPILRKIKKAQSELEKTRIQIVATERANLKKIAKVYSGMSASDAAEIMEGMHKAGQAEDCAKIVYYMTDRSASKLLQTMTDKGVAGMLTEALKRIQEKE